MSPLVIGVPKSKGKLTVDILAPSAATNTLRPSAPAQNVRRASQREQTGSGALTVPGPSSR